MAESSLKILVTLGVTILLALLAALVKLGVAFGGIEARLTALEGDDSEDKCMAKIAALEARVNDHDGHLREVDVRCDERQHAEHTTGKHILEG